MQKKHGNRVQRTRFPCTENEFIELVFYVWKTSSVFHSLNLEDNECLAASNVWLRLQKMDRELVVGFA